LVERWWFQPLGGRKCHFQSYESALLISQKIEEEEDEAQYLE